MTELKIYKKGSRIELPIKYNFKYKVLGKENYETPLERQDLVYHGDLYKIYLKDIGFIFSVTSDHRCNIVIDGKDTEKKAKDLIEGDLFRDSNSNTFSIEKIEKENYDGIVCDFTMPSDYITTTKQMLSMNCRLRLDLRQIRKQVTGGLFGSSDNTGCYDDETEVLTKKGWKFFKNVNFEDDFYTMTSNRHIELHKPENIFEYDYKGDMYCFRGHSLDLRVTPNHNMAYINKGNKNDIKLRQAQFMTKYLQLPSQCVPLEGTNIEKYVIKASFSKTKTYEDIEIPMDTWLNFLGLFISEGSSRGSKIKKNEKRYEIIISQTKINNLSKIRDVFEAMPFTYTETVIEKSHRFCIANKSLWEELTGLGNSLEKYIPNYVWECSARQLNILYESLMLGDGHKRYINGSKLETHSYYTSSPKLADDMQHLLMRLGSSSTKSIRPPRVSNIKGRIIKSENPQYTILRLNNYGTQLKKNDIEIETYEGKVYCVEVPNHILFIRRHGRTVWCGNSVGVVTINMPKIGYLAKDENDFYSRLDHLMDLAAESLDKKRKFVENMMDLGMYPYTKRYLGHFNNHFSTIGLIGMNECCLNFLKKDIADEEAKQFTMKVMIHMRDRLSDYQEKTGALFNLEATPAEGVSYRFAKHDKENLKDIITAGTESSPYYTNSSNLPVGYTGDVWEALNHQNDIQQIYTGGCVFHTYLSESINDADKVSDFIKKVFENTRLPYLTLSPTFSVCQVHGFLKGDTNGVCPICQEEQKVEYKKAKERLLAQKEDLLK
jgi:hypothetical protein